MCRVVLCRHQCFKTKADNAASFTWSFKTFSSFTKENIFMEKRLKCAGTSTLESLPTGWKTVT